MENQKVCKEFINSIEFKMMCYALHEMIAKEFYKGGDKLRNSQKKNTTPRSQCVK